MLFRSVLAACAAVAFCAATVQTAEAYPITARLGTTTVTGVYRPLELKLDLVPLNSALTYDGGGSFSFSATFSGGYKGIGGIGYSESGFAGNWDLLIKTGGFPNVSTPNNVFASSSGSVITLNATALDGVVGTLTYTGGGDYVDTGFADLHPEDTPQVGDFFEFYPTAVADFLQVNCLVGGTATCSDFDLTLLQGLRQLGPYTLVGSVYEPDESRVNLACIEQEAAGGIIRDSDGKPTYKACGGVKLTATSIPEPASLALVGLALGGLAFVRRRRRTV